MGHVCQMNTSHSFSYRIRTIRYSQFSSVVQIQDSQILSILIIINRLWDHLLDRTDLNFGQLVTVSSDLEITCQIGLISDLVTQIQYGTHLVPSDSGLSDTVTHVISYVSYQNSCYQYSASKQLCTVNQTSSSKSKLLDTVIHISVTQYQSLRYQ